MLPLSIPALASFAIFQFLWVWNDYLVALIFLGGDPNFEVHAPYGKTGYIYQIGLYQVLIGNSYKLIIKGPQFY